MGLGQKTTTFVSVMFIGLMSTAAFAEPQHGIAMHGAPLHGPDFESFPYANPDAPKGGDLKLAAIGSFDSLNPLIIRGVSGGGVRDYVFESLMARAYDEPFSLYGLLAETIETPDDRSWVEFRVREEARFSDGTPVTVDDVVFSLETLRDKGRPNHKYYYSKVAEIVRPDAQTVRFVFGPDGDREMPLIMGLMPIIPKHIYETRAFDETTLVPPIGSGPYVITEVEPGARLVYTRSPDYWGKDLAVNRGHYNFDRLIYDYFRDANASFEAFKAGLYDIRPEDDPTRWATGFDIPAVRDGRITLQSFTKATPSGMRALVYNTRRAVFSDPKVRAALGLVFDFEWVNTNFYYSAYERTQSFYDGSELASSSRPASEAERALLAPYPGVVSDAIMSNGFTAPVSDGTARNRQNRRAAIKALETAGWVIRDGVMVDAASGQSLSFEITVATPEDQRLALNYSDALKGIGVEGNVRYVDSSQYQQLRQTYDFDMIFNFWYASLSPGNEQSFYWGMDAADQDGTRNYMGVKEPAVDGMIEAMLVAREREEFVAAVRALDRVLLSGDYVIPLFYQPDQWVAHWSRLKHPEETSLYGYKINTWWAED
ncbi:extracellular solute-binding protein [Parvibaculaceae bacterium PLY_AMNH_Bact1]|nr:extracellular solute-binding protein [Parvibaculaceae bacterium PLY_AMNH_Bact1]